MKIETFIRAYFKAEKAALEYAWNQAFMKLEGDRKETRKELEWRLLQMLRRNRQAVKFRGKFMQMAEVYDGRKVH